MPNIATSGEARSRLILGQNSKIELIGTGLTNKILEVTDHCFWPDNRNGSINTQVLLRNGKVEMGPNAVLNFGTPIDLYKIKIQPLSGVSTYKGIYFWGDKHRVYNTEIIASREGFKCLNTVGGHDFIATLMNVNNSPNGLYIEGKGYKLSSFISSNITSNPYSGIKAIGINRHCHIGASNFDNIGNGVSHTGGASGGLTVAGSSFTAEFPIYTELEGSLLVQCNTFERLDPDPSFDGYGLTLAYGRAELAPTLGRNAGGNLFSNFTNSVNLMYGVDLHLEGGANNLSAHNWSNGLALLGVADKVPSGGQVQAENNQWDLDYGGPRNQTVGTLLKNYDVDFYSTGGLIDALYFDGTPLASYSALTSNRAPRCNFSTPYNPNFGGIASSSSKEINSAFFSHKPVKQAFTETLAFMYEPQNMDLTLAANYWKQILTNSTWTLPLVPVDIELANLGIDKMMENVGEYLMNDTTEANSLTLDNSVLSDAKATLEFWQGLTASDTNKVIVDLFAKSTLDRAHILHHANQFSSAINEASELSNWATGNWLKHANYWQCQWTREENLKLCNHNIDSALDILDCNYEYPGDAGSSPIGVESRISDIFRQVQLEHQRIKEYQQTHIANINPSNSSNLETFKIYPNPANSFVIAEININYTSKSNLTVYSVDGKEVSSIQYLNLSCGQNRIKVDISMLSKGFYTITIVTDKGKYYEKIVVD